MPDLTKEKQSLKDGCDSDESLMILFQQGDGDAFHPLFERYCARIINFAYRFLNSREEAEDITQDVFLRIYGKKLSYDSKSLFRPWLYSIVSHLISNKLRDKKRHPHQSLDWTTSSEDGDGFSADSLEISSLKESDSPEKVEIIRSVQSAIQGLPENQRTAVILARFESMPYEEIASAMGISLSSVTSLLFRARQTLKKALLEDSPR
jgi:RNA polymerase sigma-70 factor (ECF subfamily)